MDARKLLDQFIASGAAGGFAGGLAGGALASAFMGKKGRKLTKSAVKIGGLALVGGLAYKAWQNHKQSTATGAVTAAGAANPAAGPEPVPAVPQGTGFLPSPGDTRGAEELSQLIVRAMISAAKADGQIDTREGQMILQQVNSSQLDEEDKAFLFAEYAKPLDIEGLVAAVDSPEHAAEVYAASVLVAHPASPAEKIYLDTLSRALQLEPGLVRELHSAVESSTAT
jgi:uncharacterized membrane protein YebE (DUF533 family)